MHRYGMPREADNHIRVTDDTWQRLNSLKRPGDSFDAVIQRLLDEREADEGNSKAAAQTAD